MNICKRCGHTWLARTEQPAKQCPGCKSTRWDRERTQAGIHALVARAINRGELAKLDGSIKCLDCGEPATAYDHRDYSQPLVVEPVCDRCNKQRGPGVNRPANGLIATNIALTNEEYTELRIRALDRKISLAELLAMLARKYLEVRTNKGNAVQ